MQWAEEGEKPSIFFINLENIFFTNKTIPKLVNADITTLQFFLSQIF
jgi:hypothetical protein